MSVVKHSFIHESSIGCFRSPPTGGQIQAMLDALTNEERAARISALIREVKKSKNVIAESINVSAQAITGWEKTGRIGRESAAKLCAMAGKPVEYLTMKQWKVAAGRDDPAKWPDVLAYKTSASLGDGQQPDDWMETHSLKFRAESLIRKRLSAGQLGVVYGKGDSMMPRIHDGDAILFDRSDREPRDGYLYVITYGNDLLAKKLVKLGGRWFIESLNKDDPKWAKPQLIDEVKHFEIHGRVRWIGSWED